MYVRCKSMHVCRACVHIYVCMYYVHECVYVCAWHMCEYIHKVVLICLYRLHALLYFSMYRCCVKSSVLACIMSMRRCTYAMHVFCLCMYSVPSWWQQSSESVVVATARVGERVDELQLRGWLYFMINSNKDAKTRANINFFRNKAERIAWFDEGTDIYKDIKRNII